MSAQVTITMAGSKKQDLRKLKYTKQLVHNKN